VNFLIPRISTVCIAVGTKELFDAGAMYTAVYTGSVVVCVEVKFHLNSRRHPSVRAAHYRASERCIYAHLCPFQRVLLAPLAGLRFQTLRGNDRLAL